MARKAGKGSHGSRAAGPELKAPDPQDAAPVVKDPVAETDANWPRNLQDRLARLEKTSLEVSVELGRTRLTLEQVLNLEPGMIVDLEKLSGNPVEVRVNGTLFGRGEVVVIGEQMAVRMTELLKPEEME